MIKHISFDHGWFYHYRMHSLKTEVLCKDDLIHLKDYLNGIFNECPNDYFLTGPRSSKLRFDMEIKPTEVACHEVCKLAEHGLNNAHYGTAHTNVQMFMLQHDCSTIGVEVPVWLESKELETFEKVFGCKEPLSGHIDAVRIEDGKVWVWDYKPNAHLEKYATTQVFFYALMLSRRTGISLDKFMCGYFDEDTCYVFKPELNCLKENLADNIS